MRKMKLSFSLILTIILVGILSTAALARGTYWESASADGAGGFNFKFINTEDTAKDFTVKVFTQDSTTKDFTVFQFESAAVNAPSYPVPTGAATEYKTINIAKTDITGEIQVGTIYKLELVNSTGTTVGVKFGVLTDSANLAMASIASDPANLLDVDGSKLVNANHTGMSGAVTKRTGQKTHGFYQNNTNSCAGCHQTHTGSDSNLLFKDGVYSTCSACHDGTTGAYNSFAPVSEENAHSIAGTFNVQTANHNGSLHAADGSLKVAAAPGGNVDISSKQFGQEFDCASCHSPHGNGSLSENNLNLDPLGWGAVAYGTTSNDAKYGKLFNITTIYDEAAAKALTTMDTPYILVKHTVTATDLGTDAKTLNFFLKRQAAIDTNLVVGTDVIMTYRWNGSKHYVADYSLWLREKGYPFKADTKLLNASGTEVTNLTVVWKDGFAYGAGLVDVTKAQLSLGIDVETTSEVASLWNGTAPQSGVEMSKYCASCHTDYLSATRNDVTGVYTQAHRHQTATDELTCVRCHFGHGSEAQLMKDANDKTYYDLTATGGQFVGNASGAIDYLTDPNPSSALKRYTGMAVCYACHGNGEQFLGNPNNITRPMLGKPGDTRTAVTPN